jgi:hypothetical protein
MANINKEAMKKGYLEMAEINLILTQEFFHLENEGEKLNEMGAKETKEKA